jgi:peroxiredoxin
VYAFAPLLLSLWVAADSAGTANDLEIVYEGRLTPVSVAEGKASPKGFTATWFLPADDEGGKDALFVVSEDAFALPWTARFGFSVPSSESDGPRIGYHFADRDAVIPLPGAKFPFAQRIADTPEFREGDLSIVVEDDKQVIQGRECRIVAVDGGPAHRQKIAVERETGLLVRFESDIFLGRGHRFRLTLEQTMLQPGGDKVLSEIAPLLREIDVAIESTDRASGQDLSPKALEVVAKNRDQLVKLAQGTVFEPLAQTIARSVSEQHDRRAGVDKLAQESMGKKAPSLELKSLSGEAIDPATFTNKVVVLHFWDYDNEQLSTPYGQVGYLDHLSRQRKKDGVEVIGVAVDARFGDAKTRTAATRSVKKLVEFMNLTYPVAGDDGALLKAIGDPRPLGASLPLWVVIGRDGIIREYKSGLYDLKANEGLKELDAKIVELAK